MGYSVQNLETGEVDYIRSDFSPVQQHSFDVETGEPLNDELKVRYVKHNRFQIPKKYLRATPCEEFEQEMTGEYRESYQPSSIQVRTRAEVEQAGQQYHRDDYINMECVKNDIILGYNKPSFRLFLIPTLFCFNIYFALFIGLMETFLHIWAHWKNGLNMNKEVYFRSPLHVLTSQFCARCRSEHEMEIQLFVMLNKQMRKARQSRTLKDVTKAIA